MADGQNDVGVTLSLPMPRAGGASVPSTALAPSRGADAGVTLSAPLPSVGSSGADGATDAHEVWPLTPDEEQLPGANGLLKEGVNFGANAVENFVRSGTQTIVGADKAARKYIPAPMTNSWFGFGKPANLEEGEREAQPVGGPVSQAVGYGGETLFEFLEGDTAFKALSTAKKFAVASDLAKTLEQSPRVLDTFKLGAIVGKVLKSAGVNSLKAGTIAGLQSFLKSGGNVQQALHDALVTGAVAAPIGVATGAVGELGSEAGKSASAYKSLTEASGKAATKEQVASNMAERLNAAEKQMHNEYQSMFDSVATRTGNATLTSTHTELARAASEALQNQPEPGTNPLVASARKKIGEALDPKVQELLNELSSGSTANEIKAHAGAVRAANRPVSTGLVDANGQEITHAAQGPEPLVPHEYTGKDLIELRQIIRKMSENFEYGNVNSRVLRSLISSYGDRISPMDQTLGQLASVTGDDTLVDDYMKARKTYMEKHSVFENNRVIDNLRQGKVGDAAQGFVNMTREGTAAPTTGKAAINIRDLRTVLGDDGVHAFGKEVFGTVLQDSMDKIGDNYVINPDKFLRTMQRFDPATLDQLIDWGDVNNGLAALKNDAQAAATLQKLTRLGVISGVGTVAGAMPHVGLGTLVGMTAGEGGGMGGIAQGRRMLDWIANNPKMWSTWARIGKIAESPAAKKAASATGYSAGKLVSSAVGQNKQDQGAQKKAAEKDVYGGLGSSLGGPQ